MEPSVFLALAKPPARLRGPVSLGTVGVSAEKELCECMVKIEVAVEGREMKLPGRACLDVVSWDGPTGCHGLGHLPILAE
jgi:hypothetical protein